MSRLICSSPLCRQVSETMPWSFSPLRAAASSTLSSSGAGTAGGGGRDSCCGSLRVTAEEPDCDDASCGSLASLRAAAGRLSESSCTLRADESGAALSPPPPPAVTTATKMQLSSPATASAVPARSRFYVRLDGGGETNCEMDSAVDGGVTAAAIGGRSQFYLPLTPASATTASTAAAAAACERADADSGCDSSEPAPASPVSAPVTALPALVVTDTAGAATGHALGHGLAPPHYAVSQSRSCEPLCRGAASPVPPPPSGRRLSRSSADVSGPVRFLVGGDDEPGEEPRPERVRRPMHGGSESSDDDSGLAGCERCAAPVRGVAEAEPPPLPGPESQTGAARAPLSRRHSDSIRDTSQYLRGYRSLRFSQPASCGRAARKARHVSEDGGSPPPVPPVSAAPQAVQTLASSCRGCRCLHEPPSAPPPSRLREQVRHTERRLPPPPCQERS